MEENPEEVAEFIPTIQKVQPSTNYLEIARFQINTLLNISEINIQMISDQDFDFESRMLFIVDSSGDIIAQSNTHTKV